MLFLSQTGAPFNQAGPFTPSPQFTQQAQGAFNPQQVQQVTAPQWSTQPITTGTRDGINVDRTQSDEYRAAVGNLSGGFDTSGLLYKPSEQTMQQVQGASAGFDEAKLRQFLNQGSIPWTTGSLR